MSDQDRSYNERVIAERRIHIILEENLTFSIIIFHEYSRSPILFRLRRTRVQHGGCQSSVPGSYVHLSIC